jgi:hypothetical protein
MAESPPETTDLQYKVDAARTKPAVDTWEGYGLMGCGAFYVIFSVGFSCLLLHALITEVGSIRFIRDIDLFEICGGLFGVLVTLVLGFGSIYMVMTGISTFIKNQNWMRGATKARATIIDRREEQTITAIDYKYGGYTMTYGFILRVDDRPEVSELNGRLIWADVSEGIFKKYAGRDSVVIYYATDSPLTFILKGE